MPKLLRALATIGVLALLFLPVSQNFLPKILALAAQTPPALQITAPSDGSLVIPGQTISVSVTSPAGISFKQVFVIGWQPLPTSTMANSVPAQLSLVVPQKIALGKYFLTAWGATAGGEVLGSSPLNIDVERADLPNRLTFEQRTVIFVSQGEQRPLRVRGTFSDRGYFDVTRSSNLAFSSSNTSIATVDRNGIVKAVAQGSGSIIATYSQGAQNIKASIAVSVPSAVKPE